MICRTPRNLTHPPLLPLSCLMSVFGSSCPGMVGIPIMSLVPPGRGRRERHCRHPQQIMDTQTRLSRGGDSGMTSRGMVVSLAPYITTVDRSGIVRLRHRDELWDDYETRHYAIRPEWCAGVASLGSHHKAQWWAFTTLWARNKKWYYETFPMGFWEQSGG